MKVFVSAPSPSPGPPEEIEEAVFVSAAGVLPSGGQTLTSALPLRSCVVWGLGSPGVKLPDSGSTPPLTLYFKYVTGFSSVLFAGSSSD